MPVHPKGQTRAYDLEKKTLLRCLVEIFFYLNEEMPFKHKKLMSPFFSVAINLILFKVGGYKDMHNTLYEFEILPDGITDYGGGCP